jgi:hypothetical protein
MKLVNGFGALRSVLEKACAKTGASLSALTVLSAQVDPYRLDTDAGHRDGRWVAEQLDRLLAPNKQIHWRGLHYLLVSTTGLTKPNGETYRNIDEDWTWLVNIAGKSARWLGYVPFESITDNRNAEPVIFHKARIVPKRAIAVGIEVTVPDVDDLAPAPVAEGFVPRQAYHFVMFGEKASLESVLLPIARAKQADLYLPTGEISDTLLFRICCDAAEDGRPLVLFTISDCDPAGYQMPISIGRKLQAFRDLLFPRLKFEVVPVAQAAIDAQLNPEIMAAVRAQAETKLTELRSAIDALNEQIELATDDFTLPEIEVPEPEIDETIERLALVSFDDDFVTATRALIERKRYGNGDER